MPSHAFNISLPQELVDKADQVAKQEYKNRSQLIRDALRLYIEQTLADTSVTHNQILNQAGIDGQEDVVKITKEYRRDNDPADCQ